MKNIILFILTSFISFTLCGCALNFYNRSSVTSYQNNATTDGRIKLDNQDAHSVDGDKEKALSTALSKEGTASASEANASKNDSKETK